MSKKQIEVKTESVTMSELAQLRAENDKLKQESEALKLAFDKVKKSRKFKTYLRTQKCKTANSYHKSVAQLLDDDFEKVLTEKDIVERDDDAIVITDDFDRELIDYIKECVKKFRR